MQKTIVLNRMQIDRSGIRLFVSAACTAELCVLYALRAHFIWQLLLYVLLLWNCKDRLLYGLEMLSAFTPNADTLLLFSAFAALLHGIATLAVLPYYVYTALALLLAEWGDESDRRLFGRTAQMQRVPAKIFRILTAGVLLLFSGAFTVWLSLGVGIARAAEFATTAVIVFCPVTVGCIFSLCNYFAARGGSMHGIRLQVPDALVKLWEMHDLQLADKGIVYADEPVLYDVYATDADKIALLSIAASIEQKTSHPFAKAIVLAAAKLELPLLPVEDFIEFRGKGVRANLAGEEYFLGNKRFFRENGIALPDCIRTISLGGNFPLYAAKSKTFCGMLLLGSKQKEDVSFVLRALSELSVRVFLCVQGHKMLLGADEEKVLQECENNATIKTMLYGMAPEKGTPMLCSTSAAGSADVLLEQGDLYSAYCAVLLGKKARGTVFCNAVWTAVIGLPCLAIATGALYLPFGIFLTPGAALLSAALTLAGVLLNTLRLRRFAPPNYTPSEADDMFGKVYYTMKIEGMSCAHCSARVKTALETLRGTSAEISLEDKAARVKCPASLHAEQLTKAVEEAGYTVLSCERV